jgi:phytanoyl-CoA hydroxylase
MSMVCRFLQPNAVQNITALDVPDVIRRHASEVVERGYAVIPAAVSAEVCRDTVDQFRAFERAHAAIFAENRNAGGHYPRIVNLHRVFLPLIRLFTDNPLLLSTLDVLFGRKASLYTSLFYESGSQQPLHRDTPLFATRPEYMYFGVTVYLEPADDDNGCLEVLQGGHKIPELDRETLALRRYGSLEKIPPLDNDAWSEYQDAVVGIGRSQGMQTSKIHVNTGDTLIWHPQMPHGGSAIRDGSRSRLSLVMHVTPEDVPVYHQDVFFSPSRQVSETPTWTYCEINDRKIAKLGNVVSFGHTHNYPLSEFSWPKPNAYLE